MKLGILIIGAVIMLYYAYKLINERKAAFAAIGGSEESDEAATGKAGSIAGTLQAKKWNPRLCFISFAFYGDFMDWCDDGRNIMDSLFVFVVFHDTCRSSLAESVCCHGGRYFMRKRIYSLGSHPLLFFRNDRHPSSLLRVL